MIQATINTKANNFIIVGNKLHAQTKLLTLCIEHNKHNEKYKLTIFFNETQECTSTTFDDIFKAIDNANRLLSY